MGKEDDNILNKGDQVDDLHSVAKDGIKEQQAMHVVKEGKKKTILQVGKGRVIEQTFTLKPVDSKDKTSS